MNSSLTISELEGPELAPWLDALGALRIRVFREYPYLYDGTLEYEREYLGIYQKCPSSLVVVVTDTTDNLIGSTTCMPLADEGREFQAPFLDAGIPVNDVLYFGESIVLPEWRGIGLGKEFFVRREAHARRLGLATTAFCAVDRPDNHPLRPPAYRPLDGFWNTRGYTERPGLQAVFTWKETGEETESPKSLTYWTKTWTP